MMKTVIPIHEKVHPISGAAKNLRVVDKGDDLFPVMWRDFLTDYPIHTYRHDLTIYEYRKLESVIPIKDRSFVLVDKDDKPLAICPLFIVEDKSGNMLAAFGEGKFTPILLTYPNFSEKQRRSAEDCAFNEYMLRLEQENVERWMVEADILSVGTDLIEDQVLARKGALDVSIHQHIVDIRGSEEEIRSQLRRRALTEINGGLNTYEFVTFDKNTYTDEVGKRHFDLHEKTSGRVTRPYYSFEESYNWVRRGKAFFVEQRFNQRTVNMTLVLMSKRTAVGASTADDPSFKPTVPLMHSMMWKVMIECKKRAIEFLEIGETNFRETMHQILTPKEKNIIYFKRGFGEYSWAQKRWIWFRNKDAEIKYLKEALCQYERRT